MIRTALLLVRDLLHFVILASSHTSLAAENLFLRKQLAFYVERKVKPRRLDDAARIALVLPARVLDWRQLLVLVRPATLVRWHRQGFRLFLAVEVTAPWPSSASRTSPAIDRRNGEGEPDLERSKDCRGTAAEVGHRRLASDRQAIHAAASPLAARFISADVEYVCPQSRRRDPSLRFHRDRHGHFPARFRLPGALRSMNLRVLKTPARVPQANAFCERLIGTARRECLDHVIALNQRHLRKILADWVCHYNRGRPHANLGPGIPDPSALTVPQSVGHQIPFGQRVTARPILGGLRHEYRLEAVAA